MSWPGPDQLEAGAPAVGVLRCPVCSSSWLVVGVREGDRHICKSCGCDFRVAASLLRRGTAGALASTGAVGAALPAGRQGERTDS